MIVDVYSIFPTNKSIALINKKHVEYYCSSESRYTYINDPDLFYLGEGNVFLFKGLIQLWCNGQPLIHFWGKDTAWNRLKNMYMEHCLEKCAKKILNPTSKAFDALKKIGVTFIY
jgi:hypothetical protein